MTYAIVLDYDPEEHVFNASVPSLPGCYTWGKTKALAIRHAKEMIRTFLDVIAGLGEDLPWEKS